MTRCEKCRERWADRCVYDIPHRIPDRDLPEDPRVRRVMTRGRTTAFRVCPECDDGGWDLVTAIGLTTASDWLRG